MKRREEKTGIAWHPSCGKKYVGRTRTHFTGVGRLTTSNLCVVTMVWLAGRLPGDVSHLPNHSLNKHPEVLPFTRLGIKCWDPEMKTRQPGPRRCSWARGQVEEMYNQV